MFVIFTIYVCKYYNEPLNNVKAERPQVNKLFALLLINSEYVNSYHFSILSGPSATK